MSDLAKAIGDKSELNEGEEIQNVLLATIGEAAEFLQASNQALNDVYGAMRIAPHGLGRK